MDADATLSAFIARLRSLPRLAEEVAREAAPLVERAARSNAERGLDPEGKPWAPTKDGKRPLQHAAEALTAKATGAIVELVLVGHHVVHHYGTKRMPARRIVPDAGAGVPKHLADAMREGARRVFGRLMGGT